jgi:hypothetical protein
MLGLLDELGHGPVPHCLVPDLGVDDGREPRLIARGRSNAEIGRALLLAESTVTTHATRMLREIDATGSDAGGR